MLRFIISVIVLSVTAAHSVGQVSDSTYDLPYGEGIRVTINRIVKRPENSPKTILVFYALPNGNNTEQTMGRRLRPGDDWHFDIQHIRAQTSFLRNRLPQKNLVLVYLENQLKSWPAWKQQHPNNADIIRHLVDTVACLIGHPDIYLNGHSGGGSFIFGYLQSFQQIPDQVKRISFIDSDYGYDSTYSKSLKEWLNHKKHFLTVFAYNDSVALYQGKPVVSAKGGTWYRSHLFLNDLSAQFQFKDASNDSMQIYRSSDQRIQFFLKTNPDRKILHTQQVEYNGFIHSILAGTAKDSKGYRYFGPRVYDSFILP